MQPECVGKDFSLDKETGTMYLHKQWKVNNKNGERISMSMLKHFGFMLFVALRNL